MTPQAEPIYFPIKVNTKQLPPALNWAKIDLRDTSFRRGLQDNKLQNFRSCGFIQEYIERFLSTFLFEKMWP